MTAEAGDRGVETRGGAARPSAGAVAAGSYDNPGGVRAIRSGERFDSHTTNMKPFPAKVLADGSGNQNPPMEKDPHKDPKGSKDRPSGTGSPDIGQSPMTPGKLTSPGAGTTPPEKTGEVPAVLATIRGALETGNPGQALADINKVIGTPEGQALASVLTGLQARAQKLLQNA